MTQQTTYYDDISSGYDELHREEQEKKMSTILHELPADFIPSRNARLLDVGCGCGISTAPWNCNCVGIDPSKDLIALAKQNSIKPNRVFMVGFAEHIPFADHMFDLVISVTAIHNFSDARGSLLEMKRVGKGMFVFSLFKRSQKFAEIKTLIQNEFKIIKEIDEGVDFLFFATS
ncbi:class I SAM-dependent methyltransferase [Candidatus Woesearchaeota archaeon]|nr:class I SAM-dependent methyltransferase [Candidatus Woesearchaeota archaeon]